MGDVAFQLWLRLRVRVVVGPCNLPQKCHPWEEMDPEKDFTVRRYYLLKYIAVYRKYLLNRILLNCNPEKASDYFERRGTKCDFTTSHHTVLGVAVISIHLVCVLLGSFCQCYLHGTIRTVDDR